MATAIASRYARALADVVSRTGDYRRAQEELTAFAEVYHQSVELREVLKTPVVSVADKTRILDAILSRLGTSPTLSNFFRVLLANYRLGMVDGMIEAFGKLVTDRLGISQIQVSSAAQLTPAEQQALVARFEAVTRRTVEAVFQVEPGLLGGVTAQIDSTVYDGSVRGHLQRIRERLTSVRK
jgi:F-type H+-transporting ATPase subunit delta